MNAKPKIAKLLLDNGSLINAKTLNGDTALHYASLVKHKDLMLFLLDQKADKQAVNNDGLSALHYAIAMNKIEAAQTLLNKDIKITELADKGYSVLHVASAVGDPIMTTSIIEYKGGKELVNLKDQALQVSRLRKLPPQSLAKRCMNLSIHTASIKQPSLLV
jgi:ankyrin repeat protein